LVLDSDAYLRAALVESGEFDPYAYCHRPIVIEDAKRPLGSVILELRRGMEETSDATITKDIVLFWTGDQKRVITGADLLGRLLRGIS
jgi:hypothetical protein